MNAGIDVAARRPSTMVAAWAVAGAALYVVVGLVSLFVVATVEQTVLEPLGLGGQPGTSSWGIVLASHPLVWGIATAMVASRLGRRPVPDARFTIGPAFVLIVGLLLAAITMYLLHEYARERYGWFDPEYVGFANFAAPAVVAVALAGWAGAALPRERRKPLVVAHLAAVAALGLALLPSLPGVQDGIRTSSIPLATILVIDVVFAVVSACLSIARRRPV